MNSAQRNGVIGHLDSLESLNLGQAITNTYGPHRKGSSIEIERFTADEMIHLLQRAIIALRNAMEDSWKFLPFEDDLAQSNLASRLNIILNQVANNNSFELWSESLIWLIQYEVQNGFWNSDEATMKKQFGVIKGEVGALIGRLKQKTDEASRLNGQVNGLNSQIEGHMRDVQAIHGNYQQVKRALDATQQEAAETVKELRQTQIDAATSNGEATSLLKQLNNSIDLANNSFEQERARFNLLGSQINGMQQEFQTNSQLLEQTKTEFESTLNSAKDQEKHILDQRDAIAELRGFAADGALGAVFDRRRKQIGLTVVLWAIASVIVAFAAGNWIIQVVHDFPITDSASGINWGGVLTNTLRSFPALVLVYFCLAQYTKERNVQEEYAFKAAVSMTITAYAAMIGLDEERTKMLMATVQGVYTPPTLGKPLKPFSFRSKDMAELSKNLVEMTKNVQGLAADVIKSKKSPDSESEKDKK